MKIEPLLAHLVQMEGSDLHIKAGVPPVVRVDGTLTALELPALTSQDVEGFVEQLLPPMKREDLARTGDAECGVTFDRLGRFRVSAFRERGSIRFVLRRVPTTTPSLSDLNLPESIASMAEERRGLILVTGPAGTGKTTTIAAIIGLINQTRRCHIVTIEDPVEVVHPDQLSLVDQREIGTDVASYRAGMKYVVRQDPDVIFIGEIRDVETAEAAIQAAETGHLVISTMHTTDGTETVNRLLDLFPADRQHQVRLSLAGSLRGVICQRLLPRSDGGGRVPAVEMLVVTGRIRERILDPAQTGKIHEVIQEGGYYGMQTFDQSLMSLLVEGLVSLDDARAAASSPHDFALALSQARLA
jgi:twitching motility protein PilT